MDSPSITFDQFQIGSPQAGYFRKPSIALPINRMTRAVARNVLPPPNFFHASKLRIFDVHASAGSPQRFRQGDPPPMLDDHQPNHSFCCGGACCVENRARERPSIYVARSEEEKDESDQTIA